MSCNNGDCPEVIYSSDIIFDGGFQNIVITPESSVSEILLALETYFNNLVLGAETPVFVLNSTDAAFLGIAAGSYSYQQIVEAVIDKLTIVANTAGDVDTNDVTLAGIILPPCFSTFIGTTATELFNSIMSAICEIDGRIPPDDTGVILDDGSGGYTVDEAEGDVLTNRVQMNDTVKGIVENHSFIFDHTTPTFSGSSLNPTVKAMKGFIDDRLIVRRDSKVLSLPNSKDNYIYLVNDGSISVVSQTILDPEPSTPSGSHLLYKMRTSSSGVSSYEERFTNSAFNATAHIPDDDSVSTDKIQDLAVTGAKMENVVTGASKGSAELITITYDNKGRITSATSNLSLSGLSDGQILVYNASLSRFENADNTSIGSNGYLPLASAGDFVSSSVAEDGTQVTVEKNLEINTGVHEENTEAGLNVVTGTFVVPRFTAANASLLTVTNATIIYLTDTNGTFTSVGFWGVESGVWVKL